ncbi:hypothetical protein P691DRAFT_815668 [Macrolepiota fuliginosa MF-IS2]|uniref:Uncharacterized protein n=1 Tax=Macrolepiota fuliginosa MF-IS2 TaxID=1400762 RepID=A0A9P5WXL7_9AGAR|nr:hypothetical protein P691DRAFT_815668 [Macrolepiota fuliginosa MF-IS2]
MSKLKIDSLKEGTTPLSTDGNSPAASASAEENQSAIEIVACSQQSRFHRERFNANSADINIRDCNVAIGNRDVLTDAHRHHWWSRGYGHTKGFGTTVDFPDRRLYNAVTDEMIIFTDKIFDEPHVLLLDEIMNHLNDQRTYIMTNIFDPSRIPTVQLLLEQSSLELASSIMHLRENLMPQSRVAWEVVTSVIGWSFVCCTVADKNKKSRADTWHAKPYPALKTPLNILYLIPRAQTE